MFSWFWNLLLLFCFVISSETTSILVKKGSNATLPCELKDRDIFNVILKRQSKNIPVCKTENCSGRAFKIKACDVVIKDLIFSDAGKYILRVFYGNDQTELKQQREYHLHIHDETLVKIGEELKLDVLRASAEKVETNSSGDWREVWNRNHGVLDHHLTDSDGNLTIKGFTANDTGTYRVLDSENNTLITVTVREYSTESEKDKINDPKDTVLSVVLPVVSGVLVLVLIIFVVIKKPQCQQRNPEPDPYQEVPMEEITQGAQNI
ncbi:uncharacterized protein [Sinocyclocheilus grahami]|uniref:uncharacterized protein n=1 Tax=Sinocyclocheilus grahami TaxID=75366 RepID=UPI0007AD3417|nr:PREDICTED: uncharacterized protein LOC107562438 [Sinocyclocheilus grahami]